MDKNILSQPELSPLEHQVLEEYERLAGNMNKLAGRLDEMAARSSLEVGDGLRGLERKTSLAFTLLKTSVYSIVLQQEYEGGGGGEAGGSEGDGTWARDGEEEGR
ncbi:hypothetical protein E4U42_001131 [Claviceps africana]|uniref:DASH complex subunit DAD3 n=1 Tax=Claviceps africana TaxID=83212 RepID=A0A8K0J9T8_9HYPO|nr:hypothetical protein E4U42_001131 [Claviceps africana]